jgi:hypothetical protein
MARRQTFFTVLGLLAAACCPLSGCSGIGVLSSHLPAGLHHRPGCRDGVCEPHCPVRPQTQGYYETQWRRWPGSEPAVAAADDSVTPSAPPRSFVPSTDQESAALDDSQPDAAADRQPESPSKPVPLPDRGLPTQPLPTQPLPVPPGTPAPPGGPAVPGTPAPPGKAPPRPETPEADQDLFGSQDAQARIVRLASAAEAARKGSAGQRDRFTQGLIESLLAEHDPAVRARIVTEAATFQTPAADAICRGGAADPDPRVRVAACGVWERRGGPEAVRLLAARAAEDADLGVRLRAIRGLGEISDEATIAALVPLLSDPDPAVQYRVCRALSRSAGLDLGDDPSRWQEWAAARPEAPPERWSFRKAFGWLF